MSVQPQPQPGRLANIAIVGHDYGLSEPVIESLWACPVGANRYEVSQVLYRFPLMVGDQVTVGTSTNDKLVVISIEHLVPGWYIRGQLTDDFAKATATVHDLEQTALELQTTNGVFFGQWSPDYSFEDLAEILNKAQPGAGLAEIYHEVSRRDWLADCVDFTATYQPQPSVLEYWAPNDPKWRELGLASPDFLSHVQTLVRSHPDLLRLIEARHYSKALRWIEKYDQVYQRLTSA